MASINTTIDPKNGFCSKTKTFYSLRPSVPLPPSTIPLSAAEYAVSLLTSPTPTSSFLISSSTGHSLSYPSFLRHVHSLSLFLSTQFSLSPNDVAFILLPASFHVPIIYLSLLYLGVVISPANPLSSESEIAHQVQLIKPVISFTTSQTVKKLPSLPRGTILIDSPDFDFLLNIDNNDKDGVIPYVNNGPGKKNRVNQTDTAAILYSSGTTGRVKGVSLTHRNIIALLAGIGHFKHSMLDSGEPDFKPVLLFPLPMFHVFGFFMLVRAFALGETLVLLEKFDFEKMLMAVEKYKCSFMPVSPPLVVAFAKSELTKKYDLSSLRVLGSGGAPLSKEVAERFKEKFPNVEITQGYGMTETAGGGATTITPEESMNYSSVGRLAANLDAKIVDSVTGEALPPGQRGELWLRGPAVMKGYVRDDKATAEALDSDGWLRTGDLCYFDSQGFLYIVDRLKELIKYKAYQVPPVELENLLQSNPEIADAAVIPYPDEEAGQIPMAYVVRKLGSRITESQVMEFVANLVAPYKKIRRVAFINSIPRSPQGKVLRRELVNHATGAGRAKL